MSALTAEALKTKLWETIENLGDKKITVEEASAIAKVSQEIIRCSMAQVSIAMACGAALPDDLVLFNGIEYAEEETPAIEGESEEVEEETEEEEEDDE